MRAQSKMDTLPNELLAHIISFAMYQKSMYNLLLTDRRCNVVSKYMLGVVCTNIKTIQQCKLVARYNILIYRKLQVEYAISKLTNNKNEYVSVTSSIPTTRIGKVYVKVYCSSLVITFPTLYRSNYCDDIIVRCTNLSPLLRDKIQKINKRFENNDISAYFII